MPFEYPFTISNGRTKTHQPCLMVRLSLGNWDGFGEAPAIVYYNVTVEEMMEKLAEIDITDIDSWILDRLCEMIEGGAL